MTARWEAAWQALCVTCFWLQIKAGLVARVCPRLCPRGLRKPGLTWARRMCWPRRRVGQHPAGPPLGWALFQGAPVGIWNVGQNVTCGFTVNLCVWLLSGILYLETAPSGSEAEKWQQVLLAGPRAQGPGPRAQGPRPQVGRRPQGHQYFPV